MSPTIILDTAVDRLIDVFSTYPFQTFTAWAVLAAAAGYAFGRRFRYKVGWLLAVLLTAFMPIAAFVAYYPLSDAATTDPFGVDAYGVSMLLVQGALMTTPATIIGWAIGRDRRSAA